VRRDSKAHLKSCHRVSEIERQLLIPLATLKHFSRHHLVFIPSILTSHFCLHLPELFPSVYVAFALTCQRRHQQFCISRNYLPCCYCATRPIEPCEVPFQQNHASASHSCASLYKTALVVCILLSCTSTSLACAAVYHAVAVCGSCGIMIARLLCWN
jgi:hypothetical protein